MIYFLPTDIKAIFLWEKISKIHTGWGGSEGPMPETSENFNLIKIIHLKILIISQIILYEN